MKKIPKEKAFYFYISIGNYTGENASSLEEFLMKVKEIVNISIEFHLYRGDFEKWFKEVWDNDYLAGEMSKLEQLKLKGEMLRTQVINLISNFIEIQKYPPPPEEHTHELKMEKRLKRMLAERKEKRKL